MAFIKHIALFAILCLILPATTVASHLIIKSDFDGDGKADRTTFASYGISGFFQTHAGSKNVSSFYLRQGNRSILYLNSKELGSPHIKLTENNGLMQIVTIMKYDQKSFKHVKSFALANKTYFSTDPFASPDPFAQPNRQECDANNAFNNKSVKQTLSWADELKKHSLKESLQKAISPSCKTVFGDQYPKLEEQILAACGVNTGKNDENNLVKCLDRNEETKITSGIYTSALAANFFEDGFQISCASIDKSNPLASVTSNKISIYQTSPAQKDRNFKADFFHEMLHASGIEQEKSVSQLVANCTEDKSKKSDKAHFTNKTTDKERFLESKDGLVVNIPPTQLKEIQSGTVATTVAEGAKTLDSNFSMENSDQYESLSKASKATFRSFDPIMKAAYEAAIPTAFAQGSLASTSSAAGTTAVAMPTVKTVSATTRSIASTTANSNSTASGNVYDISSLPASVSASEKGELGNGLAVKAAAVNIKDGLTRTPSSSETATGGTISGSSNSGGIGGSGFAPTTDRPDLRNNVPRLKAEEDFVKTLTTGKYAEVKARLTDPKNQGILEDKRIQYVARDKTLGSKQPVMILKDLGNKFSIVRVTIE